MEAQNNNTQKDNFSFFSFFPIFLLSIQVLFGTLFALLNLWLNL